jgi:hypothetical protein
MEYTVLTTAVEQLAPQFHGQLLQSGDAGFDEARRDRTGPRPPRPPRRSVRSPAQP